MKRFLAISVLVVISKPKKEKQESIRSNCLQTITRSHKEWQLFCLKVPVSRSKRERACCFTRSFKELQLVITPRPLGLSASKFVGLWLSGVPLSTPSSVTITTFAQILLSDSSFQNGWPGRRPVRQRPVQGTDRVKAARIQLEGQQHEDGVWHLLANTWVRA